MVNNQEAMWKVPLCILVFTNIHDYLGMVTRGFLLHLQACFNIVYLGYIICEDKFFFYPEFGIWSLATKLFRDFIYVESFNFIVLNLYDQACLVRFAAIKRLSLKKILKVKLTIKFVELNLLNFPIWSGTICYTSVLNLSSTNRFRVISVQSKII